MKVVDGSSLAVAVVLNTIPKQTTQVLLAGTFSKVASSLALALCQRGIQVIYIPLVNFLVSYLDRVNKPSLELLGSFAALPVQRNHDFVSLIYVIHPT